MMMITVMMMIMEMIQCNPIKSRPTWFSPERSHSLPKNTRNTICHQKIISLKRKIFYTDFTTTKREFTVGR